MKLTIYMKSGNRITLRGVKDFEIGNRGNEIVSLSLEWRRIPFVKRLMVKTVALSQIEAVTVG